MLEFTFDNIEDYLEACKLELTLGKELEKLGVKNHAKEEVLQCLGSKAELYEQDKEKNYYELESIKIFIDLHY